MLGYYVIKGYEMRLR